MRRSTLLVTTLIVLAMASAVSAAPASQAPEGEAYVVQAGDWLSKIAQRVYGDSGAYGAIVEATNARAVEDASFAVIEDPALIRVGQKLWLPAGPGATEAGLTLLTLQNATYQGIYDEPVQLTDGLYEGEPFVPGGASRPTVTLLPDVWAYGDLNGDGIDDAAVILVESSGGSGSFIYLAAAINDDGAPLNVGTELLGDRPKIKAIGIDGNEISVEMVAHGPDDPMCCPTQEATKVYRLQGDQLTEISPPGPTAPSDTGLEGREWELLWYGDSAGPKAPLEGSQITALFDPADGRVQGSAGCNNYFAAYTLEGAAIAIGLPGSTLMACAEPAGIMEQEGAYLAALESMANYDVQIDRLKMTSADGAVVLEFSTMPAGIAAGGAYVVRPGDYLARIAKLAYGDAEAYPLIVEATNARAAEDASFAVIDNPALIRVGQKLWIPERPVSGEGN